MKNKIKKYLLSGSNFSKGVYDDLWSKGDTQLHVALDNSDGKESYNFNLMFKGCEVFLSAKEMKDLILVIKEFEKDIKK